MSLLLLFLLPFGPGLTQGGGEWDEASWPWLAWLEAAGWLPVIISLVSDACELLCWFCGASQDLCAVLGLGEEWRPCWPFQCTVTGWLGPAPSTVPLTQLAAAEAVPFPGLEGHSPELPPAPQSPPPPATGGLLSPSPLLQGHGQRLLSSAALLTSLG